MHLTIHRITKRTRCAFARAHTTCVAARHTAHCRICLSHHHRRHLCHTCSLASLHATTRRVWHTPVATRTRTTPATAPHLHATRDFRCACVLRFRTARARTHACRCITPRRARISLRSPHAPRAVPYRLRSTWLCQRAVRARGTRNARIAHGARFRATTRNGMAWRLAA